ncbi:MAG: FAD-dependent oxidoreductase, partial [Thiomargarita sp.]|nr:FAD-dependent oxidoreductase [Thiomargarita sp.]
MIQTTDTDVLIIGSGAAGLSLALALADQAKVIILSKAQIDSGSSQYAQGGISAVLGKNDTLESHVEDTL